MDGSNEAEDVCVVRSVTCFPYHAGEIPSSWRRFAVPQQCNLSSWFTDLIRRWQQLDILASSKDVSITPVWLGGLFYPEAYFTATRQIAAERSGHSIETLAMSVSVGESSVPNIGFAIEGSDGECCVLTLYRDSYFRLSFMAGLSIQCLQWDATTKKLVKGASAAHALPRCFIHWTRMEDASMTTSAVELPLYANIDRTQLLANIKLPTDLDADVVYLRGAAVIANVVA